MKLLLAVLITTHVVDVEATVWGGYCAFNPRVRAPVQACYAGTDCPAGTSRHVWYNSPFMCPVGQVCCLGGIDRDECALNQHTCDPHAACVNTIGSYKCVCNAGYTGNGFTCTNINVDECALGTHTCPASISTCQDTVTGYTCICITGYTWNGVRCEDINECVTGNHNCGARGSVCVNTVGSFRCDCATGYRWDGYTCQDIDECAEGSHNCHPTRANCYNSMGSFRCACRSGYDGNGNTCNDIDECTTGRHNCDRVNGQCTNTDGSFRCVCKAGTVGDGVTCRESSTTCGLVTALSGRIGHGQDAPLCAIPWQVSIRGRLDQTRPLSMTNSKHLCGATLIGSQHILTTAVCLFWAGTGSSANDFIVEDDIFIVAGEWDHERTDYYSNQKTEQTFTIKRWHVHPGFPQNIRNFNQINQLYIDQKARSYQANAAVLIQLNRPIQYTTCVTPVCLPAPSSFDTCGQRACSMSGWGNTENNRLRDFLQVAPVWIPTASTCEHIEYYGTSVQSLPANTTCALSSQRPAAFNCVGDQGGPVSCLETSGRWVLRGVVLLRMQCTSGAPIPIADVTKMVGWIQTTMDTDIKNN